LHPPKPATKPDGLSVFTSRRASFAKNVELSVTPVQSGVMSEPYKNYREFWTLYVSEHRDPMNRWLHFLGTTLALSCVLWACLYSVYWLFAGPLFGYAFAWFGHFFLEHNRPATFRHPLWSLRGDFQMYLYMLAGKMEQEVEKQTRQ
jgi:hypothetical protein